MSDIKDKIQILAGTKGKHLVSFMLCNVDSVNVADRSCMVTPINDNLASFRAELMAVTDDGMLCVPTKGRPVKVVFNELNSPTVIQYSQIDYIDFVGGKGIQLNGKKYGGLVEVEPLVKKINALENLVNDLIIKFNSHTHVTTCGAGAGSAAPTPTQEPNNITPVTDRADLENTLVQHGNAT